jgi:hypothetical protein
MEGLLEMSDLDDELVKFCKRSLLPVDAMGNENIEAHGG